MKTERLINNLFAQINIGELAKEKIRNYTIDIFNIFHNEYNNKVREYLNENRVDFYSPEFVAFRKEFICFSRYYHIDEVNKNRFDNLIMIRLEDKEGASCFLEIPISLLHNIIDDDTNSIVKYFNDRVIKFWSEFQKKSLEIKKEIALEELKLFNSLKKKYENGT